MHALLTQRRLLGRDASVILARGVLRGGGDDGDEEAAAGVVCIVTTIDR